SVLQRSHPPRHLHSFPTRRSSDLGPHDSAGRMKQMRFPALIVIAAVLAGGNALADATTNAPDSKATSAPIALSKEVDEKAWSFSDRKSTRLNSSHLGISYAVFCLK